jgi:hypothetical protein
MILTNSNPARFHPVVYRYGLVELIPVETDETHKRGPLSEGDSGTMLSNLSQCDLDLVQKLLPVRATVLQELGERDLHLAQYLQKS